MNIVNPASLSFGLFDASNMQRSEGLRKEADELGLRRGVQTIEQTREVAKSLEDTQLYVKSQIVGVLRAGLAGSSSAVGRHIDTFA